MYGIENRKTEMLLSSLSWRNTAHHIRTICNGSFGMECSLASCEPLANNLGRFVN
jgi:hypothetical protein